MNYYAVHSGHSPGIYNNWDDCRQQTEGFKDAKFRKFSKKSDADYFLKHGKPFMLKPTRLDSFFNVSQDTSKSSEYDLDNLIDDNKKAQLVKTLEHTKTLASVKPTTPCLSEVKGDEIHPLMTDDSNTIYIYTDGGCNNNGKKHARAGMGIYIGDDDPRNVSEEIEPYNGKKTNNIAELKAILRVYDILKPEIDDGVKVVICTDSDYSIRCCTTYGRRLKSQGWKDGKKDIPNLGLVKEGFMLYDSLPNVTFKHIMAHTGKKDRHSIGNDHADRLASLSIGNVSNAERQHVEKIYINVAYHNKDDAKSKGAKWDKGKKKWYVEESTKNKNELIKKYGRC